MEEIRKWWDHWLLYKMLDRNLEAFVVATNWKGALPRSMLKTFFEIDHVYSKMEIQKMERDSKRKR